MNTGPQSTIGVLLADKPEALGYPKRCCIVHGAVPGSPAYFSGKIKPGDLIMQVDGEEVTPENVVHSMRGNDVPGTRIKLLVDRAGRKRPFAVHLMRASTELVAQKRATFELLTSLAQAVGSSSLEQDAAQDDTNTALHRELISMMKQMERNNVEEESILREQSNRKDRALRQAQILIEEFLHKGSEQLSSKGQDKLACSLDTTLPNAASAQDVKN